MTKARDFIKPGENILAIFTKGMHFELSVGNTGVTGEWDVDPSHARSVDRILVYHQNNETSTNDLNWHDFAEAGANPIRYLP